MRGYAAGGTGAGVRPARRLVRAGVLLVCAAALLCASGCTKEAKKIRYLSRGNSDFTAGQYEKAEIEYLKVLQVAPANPTAISRLGLIYYEQGRLPQALLFLKRAAEMVPDDSYVRLKLCMAELSVRQVKDARQDAERVLQKQHGQEDALSVLADTTFTPKEVQDTTQEIEKLRQQDKDRPGYHLALGALQMRRGNLTNGLIEFRKALELDPKSAAAHTAIGAIYWMSNDLAGADQELKTAADLSPQRSARRLKYADFKLKTGSVEDAKKILEDITRNAPDYLPAWNYLAQVAFAQRKFDDCAALLQKVLTKDSINYDAVLLDANVKLNKNQVPEAIAELARLSKVYARSPEVQFRLAQAYLLNGDESKGEGALKQALALDPNFPDAILAVADRSIRKGDPVSAELSLEQLIKRRPDLAQAHLLLAAAYASQRNLDQALAVYRRMQSLFPKSAQVPYFIANVLAAENKRQDARQACMQSLELAPDFLPPLEKLVDLDIADKKPEAALERINAQIERRPAIPELQLLLAKVYLSQTNFTQAEATLLKAVQMAPDLRTSYLLLAQLYVSSGKAQQALDKLNAFVVRTNDVPALMQIGMIQESLTNYSAARTAYEKLLTVNPRFAAALNNLAYLYCEQFNELDKAVGLAEQARQLFPADPSVADTLGWIVYRKGDYLRALSLLTQASSALPEETEIECHLGMVRYQLGQEGPARLALQHALEGKKDFPGKDEARRRLAILAIDPQSADPAAQALLEKRIAADPTDPIALERLAAVYNRKGELENAAKAYLQALAQNPKNIYVLTNLAQLYSAPGRLNDAQKALDYAKDAHGAAPDDAVISQILGHLVCQSGDYKWASSLLQDAALSSPDQPAVLYDLGRAYYGLGQLSSAESAMQQALKAAPQFPQAEAARRFLTLVGLYRGGAAAETPAPQLAEVSSPSDANYIPALMVNSLLQRQKGNYQDAKKTLEQVLGLNPLFVPATRDLAILCFDHFPDDPRVSDLATKARVAFPDDPDLAKVLGVLAYRRADYAAANRFLKQSLRTRQDDAELFYYLGMAQYQLKAKTESKASLQQALALNIPSKLAVDAKRVLAEMK